MTTTTLKNLIATSLISVSLLSVSTLSQAATPSRASLTQLMEVMHMDEMMSQVSEQNDMLIDQVIGQLLMSEGETDLTEAEKTQIQQVAGKYIKQMSSSIDTPQMRQSIISAYVDSAQKHYTQAEVDAQIQFYGSAAGQSIIEKQPSVMQDYMSSLMPLIMRQTQTTMQTLMPQMQEEIRTILGE